MTSSSTTEKVFSLSYHSRENASLNTVPATSSASIIQNERKVGFSLPNYVCYASEESCKFNPPDTHHALTEQDFFNWQITAFYIHMKVIIMMIDLSLYMPR